MTLENGDSSQQIVFEECRSVPMTEGQFYSIHQLLTLQSPDAFRGAKSGSPEVGFENGTKQMKTDRNADGTIAKETWFLPGVDVDFSWKYTYENGKCTKSIYLDEKDEELLVMIYDENRKPRFES